MRSAELDLEQYDTDKIANGYLPRYDRQLAPWVGQAPVLLEIGVRSGGSLCLWRDYFPRGTIVGVDIVLPTEFDSADRIHLFRGRQEDTRFLGGVAARMAPDGFDIIIDDGAHIGRLSRCSFRYLFDHHLKPGGLYVIEDWGTGYWPEWPDGRAFRQRRALFSRHPHRRGVRSLWRAGSPSHQAGMVGFIKELVDEQGAGDWSRSGRTGRPARGSRFGELSISPGLVFVRKAETG